LANDDEQEAYIYKQSLRKNKQTNKQQQQGTNCESRAKEAATGYYSRLQGIFLHRCANALLGLRYIFSARRSLRGVRQCKQKGKVGCGTAQLKRSTVPETRMRFEENRW
jgi:hypothetical protein